MQVNASQNMYQMHGANGSGNGNNNGMRDIMQSLPQEQRSAFREQLSSLSPEERQSFKTEASAIDKTSLSSEEFLKNINDLLASYQSSQATTNNLVDIYV
ncbi:hypothetical protein [Sulfurimonas sp.]|uniref:hypothetical protein n=1 Tax=Sulfurimonas sp. TaxID=2022749 RepID=UPI003D139720